MCGISVIVNLQSRSQQKQVNGVNGDIRSRISKELEESLDRIAHRGPDSRGQWISEDDRVGTAPYSQVHDRNHS
jgi:asparagine synthase (glutamine-hydrolysing)